jgi:hypothetical protein
MSRRLIRTYAVANLGDVPDIIPASTREKKQKRTAADTESEGDDALEVDESPPKPKRGRPPGKAKAAKHAAPKGAIGTASSATTTPNPKPVTVRGKALPPRSPLPARTNRNTHPGMVSKPRAKRTSAEVTAAAERKAALQRQADKLERQRIETLAEIELQEELQDEAEERSVIRKLADASSLDDAEDAEMQSEDGEGMEAPVAMADNEATSEENEESVAPKPKQV